ncbi:MAG: hypothetical protein PHG09_04430 [Desulfuromonadaceae bacterium]|nr:hypothetical protein [Desulfuromonadaceae bacterium]
MTQRRSKIPILGGIFFLIIIIGVAIDNPLILIAILATAIILFCIFFLRKKMPEQEVAPPTEEEILFTTAQQQSHIQLLSIFIPLVLIGTAMYGDSSVLLTVVFTLSLILFSYLVWQKRSAKHRVIYTQEKKILLKSVAFGLISAALIFYFDLNK